MQHLNLNLYMILFIIIAAVVLLAVIVYALYRIRHTRRTDAMDEMEGHDFESVSYTHLTLPTKA